MGYINTDKLSRLAGVAFRNGIRLHRDSIAMYRNGSYASSLQLSILAQEELGKAFLIEEAVFRTWSEEWSPEFQIETVTQALKDHRLKQGWFNRFANDFVAHRRGGWLSRFTTDVMTGRLEQQKQDSAYAGLTRIVGTAKPNPRGRIKDPATTRPEEAERHITRVNDLLVVYSEGFTRSVYGTDIYYIAEQMTQDLVLELSSLWPSNGYYANKVLRSLRRNPVVDDPMYMWNEYE